MKKKREGKKDFRVIVIVLVILILIGAFFLLKPYFSKTSSNLDVDAVFIKVALKQGGSVADNLKIDNKDSYSKTISLSIKNLEEFAVLEQNEFELEPGELKNLKLIFDNKQNKESGVYLGSLEIYSEGDVQNIPIILEIESQDVLFDGNINILSKAEQIIPGEKVNIELKVYDLVGLGIAPIELVYFISDFEGNKYISENENLIVENNLLKTKTIELPDDMKSGVYVLAVVLNYESSVGTSSSYFKVSKGSGLGGRFFGDFGANSLIILIILVLFLLVIIFFIYFMVSRDKLLLELNRQYKRELRRQENILKEKERKDYGKLKNRKEKKELKKEFKYVKNKRLEALKKLHKKNIDRFRRIRRTSTKEQFKKRLNIWKKQGYDARVLEKRFKAPSIKEIKARVNEWKKKGYDTGVLKIK